MDGMFSVADLSWIAPALETSVRVTMEKHTHDAILDSGIEVEIDSIFGVGTVSVHLLFSWVDNGSGRLVGHFDLLEPTEQTLFTRLLPPDASWLLNTRQSWVSSVPTFAS